MNHTPPSNLQGNVTTETDGCLKAVVSRITAMVFWRRSCAQEPRLPQNDIMTKLLAVLAENEAPPSVLRCLQVLWKPLMET